MMINNKNNSVLQGANLALLGTLLSGLVGFVVVGATHPQPAWRDADLFLQNYHWVQTLPYGFGIYLLLGTLLLTCGLVERMPSELRAQGLMALVMVASACTLIFLNYIIQISFLPHLSSSDAQIISALSMSNPVSLAWSIEMWSYALMGLGLSLTLPAFSEDKFIQVVLALNAMWGVIGATKTAFHKGWPMSGSGIFAFVLWNVVFIILLGAIVRREIHIRRVT